jgi:hypothetical protein
MKKLLMGAAVCCIFAAPSLADPLPKEYIGLWCHNEARNAYVLLDEPADAAHCENSYKITPSKIVEPTTDGICYIASVTVIPPKTGAVHIIARCGHMGKDLKTKVITLRLWRDTFLDISWKDL